MIKRLQIKFHNDLKAGGWVIAYYEKHKISMYKDTTKKVTFKTVA